MVLYLEKKQCYCIVSLFVVHTDEAAILPIYYDRLLQGKREEVFYRSVLN